MDTSIYPIILEDINRMPDTGSKTSDRFMVESTGVYFESYVHILKALQDFNPGALPLHQLQKKIYRLSSSRHYMQRAPGFRFDLSILLGPNKHLMLDPTDEHSQDQAIEKLNEANVLDKS